MKLVNYYGCEIKMKFKICSKLELNVNLTIISKIKFLKFS
jgi:hypothetical protein